MTLSEKDSKQNEIWAGRISETPINNITGFSENKEIQEPFETTKVARRSSRD